MKAYVEPEEVALMEEAATNLRDRLLIRILFHLGCRISEALALEVKDVDFTQSAVTIQHLKFRIKLSCPECSARLGKSHTFCPKCGVKVEEAIAKEQEHRRIRTLPVDIDTLKILEEYVQRGGPVLCDGKKLDFRHQSPPGLADHQGMRHEGGTAETGKP
jgi:integrase/recombinase XerD